MRLTLTNRLFSYNLQSEREAITGMVEDVSVKPKSAGGLCVNGEKDLL